MNESYPPPPCNIGKKGKRITPDGKITHFMIEDEIVRITLNAPYKLLYLQKIKYENDIIQLRLAYYIIGKKPKMQGRWVFGQFAPLMSFEDFRAIVDEARKKSWL